MKYLLLLYGYESGEAALSPEERRAIVDEHMRFHAGLRERALLVHGEPLGRIYGPAGQRRKRFVTDGPFTETKEAVGGYAIMQCKDKAEALEWTKRFLQVHEDYWTVTCEVREIAEG
jgi:hypothetical protein